MIKDQSYYTSFKNRSRSKDILSIEDRFRILDALYEEACQFGHFGKHDLLLGLEDDIRLAAALNLNVSIPSR